jgi:hypothetical protein
MLVENVFAAEGVCVELPVLVWELVLLKEAVWVGVLVAMAETVEEEDRVPEFV